MPWIVEYLSPRGTYESCTAEGLTPDEASRSTGIPRNRIASVRRDWSSDLRAKLREVKLSTFDQVTLLSSLAAAASSGNGTDSVFRDFLNSKRSLRKRVPDILAIDLTSERLRALNVDLQAVVSVEAGERISDLGGALRRAGRELNYRRKLLKRLTGALMIPTAIAVVSLVAVVALPTYMVPLLEEFQDDGFQVETGTATEIASAISYTARERWFVVLGVLVCLYIVRASVWRLLKPLPLFSAIDDYRRSVRAVKFLTLFRPLYMRGVGTEAILEIATGTAKSADRPIYEQMLEELRQGAALTSTLRAEHWPKFMLTGLSGFEGVTRAEKDTMLTSTSELLEDRIDTLADRLSFLMTVVGMIMGAATVFLIAFGVYLPLGSASGGF